MKKKIFLLAASLLSILGITKVNAQDNRSDGAVASPISLPTISNEVFRFKPGLVTHFLNGNLPTSSGVGFGSTDRWLSFGEVNAGSQQLYGYRTQFNGRGLVTGYSTANPLNPFIQWGGAANPGNLEFRSFTNSGTPGTPGLDDLRFSIRGANGTSLFGRSASLQFISPIFGTPETPQLEINAFDNIVGGSRLGFGVYTQDNKAASFITEGDPSNINAGDNVGVAIAASGAENTNTGLSVISTPGVAGFSNNNYGVFATANDAASGYGILARANNNFWSTGINAFGTGGNAYGIVAGASGSSFQAAAFFNGDTYCTSGSWTGSDKRLKKDIETEKNALDIVKKLNPVNYYFNQKDNNSLSLNDKKQHGFISQEVEEILPELVQEVTQPINEKSEKTVYEKFKALNYNGFISLLTKAIQEQQIQIEELRNQLTQKNTNQVLVVNETANPAEAKEMASKAYMLAQNVPNPFTSSTTIKYTIPENKTAMIAVFDLNGKMLLQFPSLKGAAQVTINGNTLQAGMYLYSLLVNGQEIITKKMILTK